MTGKFELFKTSSHFDRDDQEPVVARLHQRLRDYSQYIL